MPAASGSRAKNISTASLELERLSKDDVERHDRHKIEGDILMETSSGEAIGYRRGERVSISKSNGQVELAVDSGRV